MVGCCDPYLEQGGRKGPGNAGCDSLPLRPWIKQDRAQVPATSADASPRNGRKL